MHCPTNSKKIREFWNCKQTEKELQKIAAEHFECEDEEPHHLKGFQSVVKLPFIKLFAVT